MSRNRRIVDLSAIEHNMRLIRNAVPQPVRVLAVVKADGYGHLNRACLDLGVRRGNRGGDFIRVKALDLRLGSDHGDADILGGDLSLICA